jgi:hypothetical protein
MKLTPEDIKSALDRTLIASVGVYRLHYVHSPPRGFVVTKNGSFVARSGSMLGACAMWNELNKQTGGGCE